MDNRRDINRKADSKKRNMDIAVIGIACRFPNSRNYHEFWENLKNGVNSIQEITKERWDINKFYSQDKLEKNRSYCKWSGCLEKFEYFDNKFFNISPREAFEMDPHQRQLLEVSWQCVEDAGIPVKRLQDRNTSVLMSESNSDYKQRAVWQTESPFRWDFVGKAMPYQRPAHLVLPCYMKQKKVCSVVKVIMSLPEALILLWMPEDIFRIQKQGCLVQMVNAKHLMKQQMALFLAREQGLYFYSH
jgi:hypothetical protein